MTVGERVRQIRHTQGRTVTELATASGLSRSFVTRVEAGEGNPSLESLEKLANALGVSVVSLMAGGSGPLPSRSGSHAPGRIDIVRRRREDMRGWRTNEHLQLGFLRPGAQAPLEIALEAGTSDPDQPVLLEDHGGDEFGIVLDGSYELLTADGRQQVLEEGDTIRISGQVLHQVRPFGDRPSRILWVVSPPE
ncbi:MAG: XRE family transcriptional regulator [Acidimicrobiales bacterium]|nr:XRE family transcriptional regulator [Acidimicrobiales bacterium]